MFGSSQCDSKKKRNRDPLQEMVHEKRTTRTTETSNYYLTTRARDDSKDTFLSNRQKSLGAVSAKAGIKEERDSKENTQLGNVLAMPDSVSSSLGPGVAALRRTSIQYCFEHIYGAPAEDLWVEYSVVWGIMQRLSIPAGSSREVKQVMRDVWDAIVAELQYDRSEGERKRGSKALIQEGSVEADVVFRALKCNMSTTCIAVLVNEYRRAMQPPNPTISWSAVERFILNSPIIYRSRRHRKKSGKEDEDSPWARSRTAQCIQFSHQIHLGTLPPDSAEVAASEWKPLHLHAYVTWDENHKQCILGHTSKYETLVAHNEYDEPTDPDFGGVFPPKKPSTAVKYPKEARGLFGAAMRKKPDGTFEGVKAAPFFYTHRKVVGIKNFENAKTLELARVKVLPKKPYDYKTRWPEDWEARLHKKVTCEEGALCCITELIDHIIAESKKIYKDTEYADSFFIYHDALKQFWEKPAIDYIKTLGFYDRLLRISGSTNNLVAKHYINQVVGDSPEFCRALDAHGFSDLKRSIAYHTSLSSLYAVGDARRFSMGTPEDVESTMTRCWEVAPCSARIIEDIADYDRVLKKVIEAQGCVVHNEAMRNGRRARRADDKGDCKNKPRQSQRKETMHAQPTHADCLGALDLIRGQTQIAVMEELVEEMEELVEQADEQPVEEQQDDEEGAEQDDLVEEAVQDV